MENRPMPQSCSAKLPAAVPRVRRVCVLSLRRHLLAASALGGLLAMEAQAVVTQFLYTSDAHYGTTRTFHGVAGVTAQTVNETMIQKMNQFAATTGPIDFVAMTGDISNREEDNPPAIQSASASWAQFENDYISGPNAINFVNTTTNLLLLPGNHDVSNAIGYYKSMTPVTDATVMEKVYNRAYGTSISYSTGQAFYDAHHVNYSRDIGGVHMMFVNMWPDSSVRAWMETDLGTVSSGMPVLIFTHDQPTVESMHFINPNGSQTINSTDKFENLLSDPLADGTTINAPSTIEQDDFAAFLIRHPNIKGYFHGNDNQFSTYTWTGPSNNVAMNTFQVDSPMKGNVSGTNELMLSFMYVRIDTDRQTLMAQEILWNVNGSTFAGSNDPLVVGRSTTVFIPEPASLALLSVGGFVLVRRRR
jgi:hypothetical protein